MEQDNEERALKLFNVILNGINARGYPVKLESGHGTVVEVEDVKIPIRLREKNKRTLRKESNVSWDEYDYTPTGILVFVSEYHSYKRKEYYDKPFVKLEEKTDKIIEDIISQGIFETQQNKDREIERKLEEEKQKKERERRKLVNEELSQFTSLFPLQYRWHQARILRKYLDAYEIHLKANDQWSEERKHWLTWARKKADWYDPFVELNDKALEGVDRNTLEPLKVDGFYGWRY